MNQLPMFIFIISATIFFSSFPIEIFTYIYEVFYFASLSPLVLLMLIIWFSLSFVLIYVIFLEIEEKQTISSVLKILIHSISLISQYTFFYLVLHHGGVEHGITLHMIDEKFYILLLMSNVQSVISLVRFNIRSKECY